jgi:GNAT superfamily N-acetyltransferase
MSNSVQVRELMPEDSLAEITHLIHASYAERAGENLQFWGTYQTVTDTERRFRSGQGFVAESGGQLVGTITAIPPRPDADIPLYREPGTWHFCQYAVLPEFQRRGIGRRLHDVAESYAYSHGARTMALDTAAPAVKLVEMYARWGYVKVGEWDWRPHTNYLSVIMARSIAPS